MDYETIQKHTYHQYNCIFCLRCIKYCIRIYLYFRVSASLFSFGLYDRYCGFDKISVNIPSDDGGMTGVYLNMCDLNVIKIEKDDEGNKIEKCVYAGAFGYVEFPFEFKCILSINTKYKKRNVKMEKVALEDLTFHKKFGVYSSDQVEARYMLTPVAMEKLMILQKKVGTVMMTFVDNRMYIGFPDENLFELGKFDGNISSIFDDLYDDVYNLLVLVNEIKSNNKIFKI